MIKDKIKSTEEKIVEETSRSLENAEGLLDTVQLYLLEKDIDIDKLNIHFVIHYIRRKLLWISLFWQKVSPWLAAPSAPVWL